MLKRTNSRNNLDPPIISFNNLIGFQCYFCNLEFPCEGSIYVHLTTMKHMGPPTPEYFLRPDFECVNCGNPILHTNVYNHVCAEKAFINYYQIIQFINCYGSPNMCLLCRGIIFDNRVELILHLLFNHSWREFNKNQSYSTLNPNVINKNQFKCPICFIIIKTNDYFTVHKHAVDEHSGEIGINMLKSYGAYKRVKFGTQMDMKEWLTKQTYLCYFPQNIVKRYPMNLSKLYHRSLPEFQHDECRESFTSLVSMTTHICNFHLLDDLQCYNTLEIDSHAIILNELETREHKIKQDLEVRKRYLTDRNIITNKIAAQRYCIECFRMYKDHISLQVHYLVFHLNCVWNICGICGHDYKAALRLSECEIDAKDKELSPKTLWKTLLNHEQNHINVVKEWILNHRNIPMNNDMMPPIPKHLHKVLALTDDSKTLSKSIIKDSDDEDQILKKEQIDHFVNMAQKNERAQIQFYIDQFLESL